MPAALMSKAAVAVVAGVRRPVVNAWISRDLGFPSPVGGDATRELYDPREVVDWLTSTGKHKTTREDMEIGVCLHALTERAVYYNGDFLAAVTALVCLRRLSNEAGRLDDEAHDLIGKIRELAVTVDPDNQRLLAEIRAIPRPSAWLVSTVDDLIDAAWTCESAFERVLAVRHRLGGGVAAAGATAVVSPLLAQLIAELSGAREIARRAGTLMVADLTAGSGDLLAAVVDVLGPDAEPVVAGAEADQGLARLTRRRLAVRGIQPWDCDIRGAAMLPDSAGDPDVIVTQLPYTPTRERDGIAALEALDEIAVRLKPGRFAVVLGPAEVLADDLPASSPVATERARRLREDMVEAIIRLPGGQHPFRPGYETAIWVLTQARGTRWSGRVLVADVATGELTHEVIEGLVEDVTTWRREGYRPVSHRRTYGVEKLVADLVDPPRPLLVRAGPIGERERQADAAARVTQATRCGADLDQLREGAVSRRPHVTARALAAANRNTPAESLASLITAGRLIMRPGTRIKPAHVTSTGTHLLIGPDEVLAGRPSGSRRVDRATFAARYPRGMLTEPGDVLLTVNPRPCVMIDHAGFAIVEAPVRILRIPAGERRHFTPRVLAALLSADGGTRPAGTVRARRMEDHRVILLPDAEVALLDRMLVAIESRRQLARREIDTLDELRQVAIDGLIDGTLSLVGNEE